MDYTLRRSKRARYLRIRVSPHYGVELVVPRGVSEAAATRFLSARLDWVRDVQAGFANAPPALPDCIDLPAFGLVYRLTPAPVPRLQMRDGEILRPDSWPDEQTEAALRDWLQRRARALLPDYCQALSAAADLTFTRLRVGLQTSRWGSYSSKGTMSLNAKLLLMPEPLLRYVVHHELTHSLHMDHSPAFWSALARLEPDWQRLRARLRRIGPTLPAWVRQATARGQPRRLGGGAAS